MKKLIYLSAFIFSGSFYSQVAIGKTAVSNSSVSLEFGTANKGLVLPYVNSTVDVEAKGAVDGTFIYDTSDKKVKVRVNNAWKDLSVDTTGKVDATIQNSKSEKQDAKVVIGQNAASDTTPGILVLSDKNKAMILPKVASPHLNIINPASGMLVYDTTARQVAVYNGTVWTFWKP